VQEGKGGMSTMTMRAGLWRLSGEDGDSARRQRWHELYEHEVQLSRHNDQESRSVASQWQCMDIQQYEAEDTSSEETSQGREEESSPRQYKHFSCPHRISTTAVSHFLRVHLVK
jgi:hypothetical protein